MHNLRLGGGLLVSLFRRLDHSKSSKASIYWVPQPLGISTNGGSPKYPKIWFVDKEKSLKWMIRGPPSSGHLQFNFSPIPTCPWPRVFRRLEPLAAETPAPSSRRWLRRWPLPHAAVLIPDGNINA